jgi:ubiquinone/menaquinone biosynthesis C-methylase UbiE
MTQIAIKNAAKRKLQNIQFLAMDADKIEMPSGSFDVAVSCFGFQIVAEPEVAAREILRVMKPGGRVSRSGVEETKFPQ